MDRQEYNDSLVQAANQPEDTVEDGLITFSTGVVLGTQPIPKRFMKDLYDIFEKKKPQVPVVWNDQKDRQEPNPGDPDYLEGVQKWETELMFAITDFGIMKGTYLKKKPKNIPAVEDEGWVEERKYFGIEVPNAPALRYLAWVTYIAAPEDNDQILLARKVGKLLGITEEAVETEMQKFRSDERGEADPQADPETPHRNGDIDT